MKEILIAFCAILAVTAVAINEEPPKSKAEGIQLPIERLMPYPLLQAESVNGTQACTICEYLLQAMFTTLVHYVPNSVTTRVGYYPTNTLITTHHAPTNEEEIKELFGKICTEIPSIEDECQKFVNIYGDAIAALLFVQHVDSTEVCPSIRVCPSEELLNMRENIPEHLIITKEQDKPGCSFCLLAVMQLYNDLRFYKIELRYKEPDEEVDYIVLTRNLSCDFMPRSLIDQCKNFVKSYNNEINKEFDEIQFAEDLSWETRPWKKICAGLHLCDSKSPVQNPL